MLSYPFDKRIWRIISNKTNYIIPQTQLSGKVLIKMKGVHRLHLEYRFAVFLWSEIKSYNK